MITSSLLHVKGQTQRVHGYREGNGRPTVRQAAVQHVWGTAPHGEQHIRCPQRIEVFGGQRVRCCISRGSPNGCVHLLFIKQYVGPPSLAPLIISISTSNSVKYLVTYLPHSHMAVAIFSSYVMSASIVLETGRRTKLR